MGTLFAITDHSILTERHSQGNMLSIELGGKNPKVVMITGTDESLEREGINVDQEFKSLVGVEKFHIRQVLDQTSSMEEAASILGIDPATLWRKRKRYQLD